MQMNFLSFTKKPETFFQDIEIEGRPAQVVHPARVAVTVYIPPRGFSAQHRGGQTTFTLVPAMTDTPIYLDIITYFSDLEKVGDAVWGQVLETFRILVEDAQQINSRLRYVGPQLAYRDWREGAECWTYQLLYYDKPLTANFLRNPNMLELLANDADDVLRWLVVREKMHWKE